MASEFSKFRWNDHPVRVALNGTASALATIYFNKADMDGTKVYGSQENLAAMLKVSVRTVRRAQKELETLGLIRRISTGSGFGGQSNAYVLAMPASIPDISIPDIPDTDPFSQVVSIPDTLPIPDTGVRSYRTSVSSIPDTSVRLIDPFLDPGNKPGSLRDKADTEVSAQEQASIFDDRPENPSGSEAVRDTTFDTDPLGVGCLGMGDEPHQGSALGGHEMSAQDCGTNQPTAEEGNEAVSNDPFDPFGPSQAAEADFGCWPPARSESSPADQAVHFEHPDPPAPTEVKPAIPDPLGLAGCEKWEYTDSADPRDPFSSAFIPVSQRVAG